MAGNARHTASDVTRVTTKIYLLFFPVPVVCFIGALLTDIAYSKSALLMWLHFSEWLIAAGLAFGAIAALALLVDFIAAHRRGGWRPSWPHLLLFYAALVVELFNSLVHTIDGWTAVVPKGLTLSVVGCLLAIAAVATILRAPIMARAPREAHT